MERYCNTENIYGYTVYSYHIDCPEYNENKKRSASALRFRGLRRFAFFILAPIALAADVLTAVFR